MDTYEIRVRARSGQCHIYTCHCVSVFAAVRRARSIADASEIIEVWRGMDCVFTGQSPTHSLDEERSRHTA